MQALQITMHSIFLGSYLYYIYLVINRYLLCKQYEKEVVITFVTYQRTPLAYSSRVKYYSFRITRFYF